MQFLDYNGLTLYNERMKQFTTNPTGQPIAGAAGDGETDDTDALTEIFNAQDDVIIDGNNQKYLFTKIITIYERKNLIIKNFIFYKGPRIDLVHCENITFENCTFKEFWDNDINNMRVAGVRLCADVNVYKDKDGNYTSNKDEAADQTQLCGDFWNNCYNEDASGNWFNYLDTMCKNITFNHCLFDTIKMCRPEKWQAYGWIDGTQQSWVETWRRDGIIQFCGTGIQCNGVDGLFIRNSTFTQVICGIHINNDGRGFGDLELSNNLFYLTVQGGFGAFTYYRIPGRNERWKIIGNQFIGCGLGEVDTHWLKGEIYDEESGQYVHDTRNYFYDKYYANDIRVPSGTSIGDNSWNAQGVGTAAFISNGGKCISSEDFAIDVNNDDEYYEGANRTPGIFLNNIFIDCNETSIEAPFSIIANNYFENQGAGHSQEDIDRLKKKYNITYEIIPRYNPSIGCIYGLASNYMRDGESYVIKNNVFQDSRGIFYQGSKGDLLTASYPMSVLGTFNGLVEIEDNYFSVEKGNLNIDSSKYFLDSQYSNIYWSVASEIENGSNGIIFETWPIDNKYQDVLDYLEELGLEKDKYTVETYDTVDKDNNNITAQRFLKDGEIVDGDIPIVDLYAFLTEQRLLVEGKSDSIYTYSSVAQISGTYNKDFCWKNNGLGEPFFNECSFGGKLELDALEYISNYRYASGNGGRPFIAEGQEGNFEFVPLDINNRFPRLKTTRYDSTVCSKRDNAVTTVNSDGFLVLSHANYDNGDLGYDSFEEYVDDNKKINKIEDKAFNSDEGKEVYDTGIALQKNNDDYTVILKLTHGKFIPEDGIANNTFFPILSCANSNNSAGWVIGWYATDEDASENGYAYGGFLTLNKWWGLMDNTVILDGEHYNPYTYYNDSALTQTIIIRKQNGIIKFYDENLQNIATLENSYATTTFDNSLIIAGAPVTESKEGQWQGTIDELYILTGAMPFKFLEEKFESTYDNDASIKGYAMYYIENKLSDKRQGNVNDLELEIRYNLGKYNKDYEDGELVYKTLKYDKYGNQLFEEETDEDGDKIPQYDELLYNLDEKSKFVAFKYRIIGHGSYYPVYISANQRLKTRVPLNLTTLYPGDRMYLEIVNDGTIPDLNATIESVDMRLLTRLEDQSDNLSEKRYTQFNYADNYNSSNTLYHEEEDLPYYVKRKFTVGEEILVPPANEAIGVITDNSYLNILYTPTDNDNTSPETYYSYLNYYSSSTNGLFLYKADTGKIGKIESRRQYNEENVDIGCSAFPILTEETGDLPSTIKLSKDYIVVNGYRLCFVNGSDNKNSNYTSFIQDSQWSRLSLGLDSSQKTDITEMKYTVTKKYGEATYDGYAAGGVFQSAMIEESSGLYYFPIYFGEEINTTNYQWTITCKHISSTNIKFYNSEGKELLNKKFDENYITILSKDQNLENCIYAKVYTNSKESLTSYILITFSNNGKDTWKTINSDLYDVTEDSTDSSDSENTDNSDSTETEFQNISGKTVTSVESSDGTATTYDNHITISSPNISTDSYLDISYAPILEQILTTIYLGYGKSLLWEDDNLLIYYKETIDNKYLLTISCPRASGYNAISGIVVDTLSPFSIQLSQKYAVINNYKLSFISTSGEENNCNTSHYTTIINNNNELSQVLIGVKEAAKNTITTTTTYTVEKKTDSLTYNGYAGGSIYSYLSNSSYDSSYKVLYLFLDENIDNTKDINIACYNFKNSRMYCFDKNWVNVLDSITDLSTLSTTAVSISTDKTTTAIVSSNGIFTIPAGTLTDTNCQIFAFEIMDTITDPTTTFVTVMIN